MRWTAPPPAKGSHGKPQNSAKDKLAKYCGCLGDLADAGGIAFARSTVIEYMNARAAEGWPAVRHSAAFRATWRPAYRVVDATLLPELER
jgi:hypothetical protein